MAISQKTIDKLIDATQYETKSLKQKRQAVRKLAEDVTDKLYGEGKRKGVVDIAQQLTGAGVSGGLFSVYYADKWLTDTDKGEAVTIAEAKKGGWLEGKAQTVNGRKFKTEEDYIDYIYQRLSTWERLKDSTNKGAVAKVIADYNRGAQAVGVEEIDTKKVKTLKTLIEAGQNRPSAWGALGEQKEDVANYWALVRSKIRKDKGQYDSDTVIKAINTIETKKRESGLNEDTGLLYEEASSNQLGALSLEQSILDTMAAHTAHIEEDEDDTGADLKLTDTSNFFGSLYTGNKGNTGNTGGNGGIFGR